MSEGRTKTGGGVKEEVKQEVKKPALFKVFLLNDDYTTMEFVVAILESVFQKNYTEATEIMLHVHRRGKGLCGVYTRDIAETKVETVHTIARKNEFPLMCMMEEE